MTSFAAKLVLASVGAFLISSSQDSTGGLSPDVEKLLRQGRAMQRDGNYLLAAQTFRSIQSSSADSRQQAEAIYRFVSCGDAEAKRMGINSTPDSLRQVESFRAIGINLVYLDRFERWSNADTSSRQLLASTYSRTSWGEEAAYDLISDEVSPGGAPAIEDPRIVRDRLRAGVPAAIRITGADRGKLLLANQTLLNQRHRNILVKTMALRRCGSKLFRRQQALRQQK